MMKISKELLEQTLQAAIPIVESFGDANHYMNAANHALNQALKHKGVSDEHHKWLTVHHKAMSVYHHKTGNSDASSSHDAMAERHGEMTDDGDDDFHNGESHHWSKF